MPSIIETTDYCLDELPDAGKEKARAWYREGGFDYDWFEFVYEDFERVCDILGVRLDTIPVRLFGGGTRRKPCIWFSASGARATEPASKAITATPRTHRRRSAATLPRMSSFIASPMPLARSSAAISIS
jgi:hypothetical protein